MSRRKPFGDFLLARGKHCLFGTGQSASQQQLPRRRERVTPSPVMLCTPTGMTEPRCWAEMLSTTYSVSAEIPGGHAVLKTQKYLPGRECGAQKQLKSANVLWSTLLCSNYSRYLVC